MGTIVLYVGTLNFMNLRGRNPGLDPMKSVHPVAFSSVCLMMTKELATDSGANDGLLKDLTGRVLGNRNHLAGVPRNS